MNNLYTATKVELLKLQRSVLVYILTGFFIFIPIMMSLLMLVAQHPEIAAKLGIVGTKAELFGSNDWKGFLEMINQLIAAIGLIGFGFVMSWVFGRENLEHTLTGIIALPIKRSTIVTSKFLLSFIWCILLAIVLFATAIIAGKIIQIPSWSGEIILSNFKTYLVTALFTFLVATPVAFLAGWTKGIFAPLGFIIASIILAQLVAVVGLGPYFPWAIPGIYTMNLNEPGFSITPTSYILIIITCMLGIWGTLRWWNKADHN